MNGTFKDISIIVFLAPPLMKATSRHCIYTYIYMYIYICIYIPLVFIPGYLFWLLYLFLFLLLISDNRLMSRFYDETDCREF